MKRLLTAALFGFSIVCAGVHVAAAQSDITKIIVPFAPGGAQDVLARVLAPELSSVLGETIIVDNHAGAGGAIGGAFVQRSKPDGRTLLMAASSHTIGAALDPKTPYDPIKDFTAVAHVGTGGYIFLVSARLPVKSVAELIALAKTEPGKLNYASAGIGSATHLASAYFASRAGINMVHVPFKSTAEALQSLMSGVAQMLIVPTLGSQAYVDNPDVKLIAVVSGSRIAAFPNVPTVSESGLPGFEFSSWFGLLGPASMSADRIGKINSAMATVLATRSVAEKIELLGVEPKAMSPDAFLKLLSDNFVSVKDIVKSAAITSE